MTSFARRIEHLIDAVGHGRTDHGNGTLPAVVGENHDRENAGPEHRPKGQCGWHQRP